MLSFLVFFPILFGLGLFLFPKKFLGSLALGGALFQFLLSCFLFFIFDPSSSELQMKEAFELIPFFGVNYFLAIDGLSFWYILLSALLLPLVVLFSFNEKNPLYFFLLFCLVTLSNGVFLSFDSILFYVFFELSLLPLFFLIYIWGGEKKIYASFKFLIYTFFASLFLLGGIIIMMLMNKAETGQISASLLDFYNLDFVFIGNQFLSAQSLLFFCFAFAFAVKTPLIPFHTWLPLAHVEAPTGASVYLAALFLKMGTYGWFRFILPLFPEASQFYSPLLLFLACFSLIYSSLIAFAQTDLKKLVAYSSVAHMAFVLIGVFSFNIYGLQGAFYQTLTHGISSSALFLMVGLIYKRTKTRDMNLYGGLVNKMPLFAMAFFIISLSSIAFPLTAGFISEFLVLLGAFLSGDFWVYFAISGVVLTAIYMLKAFQKIFYQNETALSKKQKDLNLKEILYLSPLVFLAFFMGVFPQFFFKYSRASLEHLNKNQYNYSLSLSKKHLKTPPSELKNLAPTKKESSYE
ncbi:MAG: NADH-quinone oxidoreductase subunit M [Bdellovibrionaceae bacterium]|nr:NADH-quinone oxidoreductase subunit M [Pseudobdellovibrionaceae bacterium]